MKKFFITSITILIILVIIYFRYNIFSNEKIKIEWTIRIWQMSIPFTHPLLKNSYIYDYYEDSDSILQGKTFIEDRKIVKRIKYYPNGNILFEIPIYNCSKHGKSKYYYENGIIQFEVDYEYGFMNGKGFEYFKNGNVKKELIFKNDLWHGDISEFDSTGLLIAFGKYENGKLIEL